MNPRNQPACLFYFGKHSGNLIYKVVSACERDIQVMPHSEHSHEVQNSLNPPFLRKFNSRYECTLDKI